MTLLFDKTFKKKTGNHKNEEGPYQITKLIFLIFFLFKKILNESKNAKKIIPKKI